MQDQLEELANEDSAEANGDNEYILTEERHSEEARAAFALKCLIGSAKDGRYVHINLVPFAVSVVSIKDIVIFLLDAFVTEEFVRRSIIDFVNIYLANVCLDASVLVAHAVMDDTVIMCKNSVNVRRSCASGSSRLRAHVIHDCRAK